MATAPTNHPPNAPNTGQIFGYFGVITLLYYIVTPSGGFIDIPTTFMLKNQLHASPEVVSTFRVITALPLYLAFIVGFIRDQWNPFGLRDRGYFLIFGPITAILLIGLAFAKLSYGSLLLGVLGVMLAFRFVASGYQGLISLIGQEKLMSGRLATLWQVVSYVPIMAAFFIGGKLADAPPAYTFVGCAVVSIAIGAFSFWKPKAVFEHAYGQPSAKTSTIGADIIRLLRHKAIYPAIIICFLWNFAPGSATPLQYFFSDHLHLKDEVYGNFNTVMTASFIPTFLLYGWLCKRFSLSKLLIWGTVFAIPQMVPLLFIHSAVGSYLCAVPMGLLGGVATAAYFDLAIRSCPPGLQGTMMMAVDGAFVFSARIGDLLGTVIYRHGGFSVCVISIVVVYALILPFIFLVPKHLIATKDGEANPEEDKLIKEEVVA